MNNQPWHVRLDIPTDTRYLHVARLTAVGAAAMAGLDSAEIDDFKIAIDEACTAAISAVPDQQVLELVFTGDGRSFAVEATTRPGSTVEIDDMTQAILNATVDDYQFNLEPLGGGFRLTKRHRDQ